MPCQQDTWVHWNISDCQALGKADFKSTVDPAIYIDFESYCTLTEKIKKILNFTEKLEIRGVRGGCVGSPCYK